jgi:hypothetical protein
MNTAKKTAICGAFCALLIITQYVFNAIKGVELVTLLFVTFCFTFGGVCGFLVAVAFCLLRCLIYGFFPSVVVLYLIYYPLLALAASALGKAVGGFPKLKQTAIVTFFSVLFTVVFTGIDCIVTPLFYNFTATAWAAYVYQCIPVCLIQCVCVCISVGLLFAPLKRAFEIIKKHIDR